MRDMVIISIIVPPKALKLARSVLRPNWELPPPRAREHAVNHLRLGVKFLEQIKIL